MWNHSSSLWHQPRPRPRRGLWSSMTGKHAAAADPICVCSPPHEHPSRRPNTVKAAENTYPCILRWASSYGGLTAWALLLGWEVTRRRCLCFERRIGTIPRRAIAPDLDVYLLRLDRCWTSTRLRPTGGPMNTYPYLITPHEPTRKQLWIAAFTSLLGRLSPEDAIKEADRSLQLCDDRWREPEWVSCWQFAHNYSVGHHFTPPDKQSDQQPDH